MKEWKLFKSLTEDYQEFREQEKILEVLKRNDTRMIFHFLTLMTEISLLITLAKRKQVWMETKRMECVYALLLSILLWNADFADEMSSKLTTKVVRESTLRKIQEFQNLLIEINRVQTNWST